MQFRKIITAIIAFGVIALGSACVPEAGEPVVTPTTEYTPGYTPQWPPATTKAKAPLDPYKADGTFRIGTEPGQIAPGTYDVTLSGTSSSGYYALCSDVPCKIGSGMMENDLLNGPGIIEIPASAVMIKDKRGIILTPAGV